MPRYTAELPYGGQSYRAEAPVEESRCWSDSENLLNRNLFSKVNLPAVLNQLPYLNPNLMLKSFNYEEYLKTFDVKTLNLKRASRSSFDDDDNSDNSQEIQKYLKSNSSEGIRALDFKNELQIVHRRQSEETVTSNRSIEVSNNSMDFPNSADANAVSPQETLYGMENPGVHFPAENGSQNQKRNFPGLILRRIRSSCLTLFEYKNRTLPFSQERRLKYIKDILVDYNENELACFKKYLEGCEKSFKTWKTVGDYINGEEISSKILQKIIISFLNIDGLMDFNDWLDQGRMSQNTKSLLVGSKNWLEKKFESIFKKNHWNHHQSQSSSSGSKSRKL